jgi:NAD(P)-dependent dehydrogenase (short-subunit alcohol dehydrogenase family)
VSNAAYAPLLPVAKPGVTDQAHRSGWRNMAGRLDGKRALIYGGGTGLGLACAQAMIEAGGRAFITGRREEKLEAARHRLRGDHVGLSAGDFTWEPDVIRITQAAIAFLGGIDTLVSVQGGRRLAPSSAPRPRNFRIL